MKLYSEQETFKIIGICMNVHNYLDPGLLEVVYKDALEIEFMENNIKFEREKEFSNEHKAQVLNYMKLAKPEVGLLVNFQTKSLQHNRFVL